MATIDYKVIKNFFSKDELKIYQRYCDNKIAEGQYDFSPISFSPFYVDDPLMLSLLHYKLPVVEKESNLKLLPGYASLRYYVFGGSLYIHRDRPVSEISVTSCLKKYDNWPLIIENETIELEEGDGLLYSGCIQRHGRPGIYKGEGMAQVLMHYVNKNGPFLHHANDAFNRERKLRFSIEDRKIIKKEIEKYSMRNKK